MRNLVTQSVTRNHKHSSSTTEKVMRSYQLVLRCENQTQREEINRRIQFLEKQQDELLTPQIVQQAVELYRETKEDRFFTRDLGKKIGKNPNIAESAFHWLHIAVKGKINKEQKVNGLFNFMLKNPLQLIEWFIFGRSPYTEISLSRFWKFKRRYVINLLTSSRLQIDSLWRKKEKTKYLSEILKFNNRLPICNQLEVVQAIDDSLFYYNNEFSDITQQTKNQKSFLRKLELLKSEMNTVVPFLTSWINSSQTSRWKSLRSLSEQLALLMGDPSRKLFSAIRLIVVFALFEHYMQSVPQLIIDSPLEEVVPTPFKRKKKKNLPIKLLMSKNLLILRQGNSSELTQEVKDKGFTLFGFPKKGKERLTAEIHFPQKVLDYINNGANIRVFQIESGKAPCFKPRVDVVLEGNHEAFHSSSLLNSYLSQIPGRKTAVLGVDINRVGQYMVCFNVPVSLPPDLITLTKHYSHLSEKVLPELSRGLLKKKKSHDPHGCCKLIGELNRVHNRRNRILREIVRRLPHFLAAVLVKKNCETFKIENLDIDATGKRGALAKAIYNMPDSTFIYKKARWLASIELGYNIKLEVVPAQNTSTIHYSCGGSLNRQPDQYDIAPCKRCKKAVNTHFNAAQNIASLAGKILPHDIFPSLHV